MQQATRHGTRMESKTNLIRLLSYNIQCGISTAGYHHYLTKSWQHVLPHPHKRQNLDDIANIVKGYDIVALQESDAGSWRSNFINQTEYLAQKAHFKHWHSQVNRNIGKLAQHSNGLMSALKPSKISEYKLPGFIPGRGVVSAEFEINDQRLAIFIVHLALGKRTRMKQLGYVSEHIKEYKNAVLLGDFNCESDSKEMQLMFSNTSLKEPVCKHKTFPSWKPSHQIDHILVSEAINVNAYEVLDHGISDHLPVAMEITL